MAEPGEEKDTYRKTLAAVLRAVRVYRGLGVSEAAEAMGMPLRSYQHFEAGGGRLNVEHLVQFAIATKCDPAALFTAIGMDAPELGVRTIRNKLVMSVLVQLVNFNDRVGDKMMRLSSTQVIAEFRETFDRLEAAANAINPTEAWLKEHLPEEDSDDPQDGN